MAVVGIQGCGYTFQNSRNPLVEVHGVRKIFVKPLVNNSYKPGVENVVYSELVKSIQTFGRIQLVQDEELADAVLSGAVNGASYASSGSTTADNLYPLKKGSSSLVVANQYTASLSCSFSLDRRHVSKKPGLAGTLWSGGFDRSKNFPGNNQLGIYGNTGPLINESEFDRTLKDMAQSMMADLNESMLSMF